MGTYWWCNICGYYHDQAILGGIKCDEVHTFRLGGCAEEHKFVLVDKDGKDIKKP